jgi:nucleoside-diphosphate-sugar epimerase
MRLDLLVNDFTFKAVSQGYLVVYEKHFMRTFVHVHDMGRSFVFAIDNANKMQGNVYNVGSSDMNFSKEQICEVIKQHVPCYVHYAEVGSDADQRNYVVSYQKLNSLGFKTTISVEDGVKELARALRAINFKTPYTNV